MFALNYGDCNAFGSCGRARIERSARELDVFVDQVVLPQSRSGKVSIVGHSQGGLMPRYWIRVLGGLTLVEDMIGLSPSNHGTDNPLAPPAGELADCPACLQQHPYLSPFTRRVNAGDETPGRISYTQIQTRFDEVVVPYFSAFLAEDPGTRNGPRTTRQNGPNTTNYCLQDEFPANPSDHLSIPQDQQAFLVVLDALERNGPARPPARPDSVCFPTAG
ncbi:MAG: esterase/lipase family protein [Thermoleophilaceae bacterium]